MVMWVWFMDGSGFGFLEGNVYNDVMIAKGDVFEEMTFPHPRRDAGTPRLHRWEFFSPSPVKGRLGGVQQPHCPEGKLFGGVSPADRVGIEPPKSPLSGGL